MLLVDICIAGVAVEAVCKASMVEAVISVVSASICSILVHAMTSSCPPPSSTLPRVQILLLNVKDEQPGWKSHSSLQSKNWHFDTGEKATKFTGWKYGSIYISSSGMNVDFSNKICLENCTAFET